MAEYKPFHSVLENHPEHVHAIGMISIELANLELFMGQMLGALIGIDPHLAEIIYLTPRTGIGRIAVLENAVAHVLLDQSTGRRKLESILARAKGIMQRRHDLIHVVWSENPDNRSEVRRIPVPITDPPKLIPVPLEYLTNLLRDIRALVEEIQTESRQLEASFARPQSVEALFGQMDPRAMAASWSLVSTGMSNKIHGWMLLHELPRRRWV